MMADFSLLLEKVPSGWNNFRLGDICTRVQGNYQPDPNGSRLYLGLEHLAQGLPMLVGRGIESDVKSSKNAFRTNDVVFGKLRPYLRKCVLMQEEGVCSTDILVFRANANVLPQYLCYLCHTKQFVGHAIATTSGIQHPRTSWNSLKEFRLTLPPIVEQHRIAHVLTTVKIAIEQQMRLIALTSELKSSLMHKLFTEGLRGEKQKETEIGLVPESWEIVKLSDTTDLRKEIANPSLSLEEIYIGLEHIESARFWWSGNGHPSEVRSAKNTFYPSDILYGKLRPYLDKAVIATSTGICSTDILVFTPKDEITSNFLVSVMHTPSFLAYAIKTTSGLNHPRTSWNSLKEHRFGLPQKDERDEIAQVMITLEIKILNAQRKCATLEELFRTLLHQLMTGQMRVNEIDLPGLL